MANGEYMEDKRGGFPLTAVLLSVGGLIIVGALIYAMARGQQPENAMSNDTIEMRQEAGDENSAVMEESMADDSDAAMSAEDKMMEETIGENMEENGQVEIVSVEAGSFYFDPNEIRVKKGQTVRIELSSVDMMHNFVIDKLGVEMPITPSGETSVIEFTADEAGEFEFYCAVGSHRAQGQVGTLIVEE